MEAVAEKARKARRNRLKGGGASEKKPPIFEMIQRNGDVVKTGGNLLCSLCFVAGSVLPAVASNTGWYIDLNGGLNSRESADDELAEAIFDDGSIAGAAIGYRFKDVSDHGFLQDLRLELACNRQFNDLDKMRLHPLPGFEITEEASGSINTDSIQQVLYYDLPLNRMVSADSFLAGFKPYIGIGLGFNRSILDGLSTGILETATPPGDYPLDYTTKWSFSYSLRDGVAYEVNPHWTLYTGGYYLKVDDHVVVEAPHSERKKFPESNPYSLPVATRPPLETTGMVIGVRFHF